MNKAEYFDWLAAKNPAEYKLFEPLFEAKHPGWTPSVAWDHHRECAFDGWLLARSNG
jgi:hypothetical protein